MTMIELVAALALFVIILGSLLTIMNTATSLWSSSRSQQREQTAGLNALDLLADDLQQAVTDSGAFSNTFADVKPTFILDARTNQPADVVQIVLQFARYAKPQTPPLSGVPMSIDAVFYTFVDNALFRHVIPLSYDFENAKPLGELLDDQRKNVDNKALHVKILAYLKDPSKNAEPTEKWSYTLLAERIDLLNLAATLPEAYARKLPDDSHQVSQALLNAAGIPQNPIYDCLKTDVLPDQIDIALRLHNEESWATLHRLENNMSEVANRQRLTLGFLFSKRITFPAQGGSRLP